MSAALGRNPPSAGKPARGGQAHQRRASPPEAGKLAVGEQASDF